MRHIVIGKRTNPITVDEIYLKQHGYILLKFLTPCLSTGLCYRLVMFNAHNEMWVMTSIYGVYQNQFKSLKVMFENSHYEVIGYFKDIIEVGSYIKEREAP